MTVSRVILSLSVASAGVFCMAGSSCKTPCSNPAAATVCNAVCPNLGSCQSCCRNKPALPPGGRAACDQACEAQFGASTFRHELALNAERPLESCDCETGVANCDDSTTVEIFEKVPSYFDTKETRFFVCSLSSDERSQLYDDIVANIDDIEDVSKEDFEGYMEELDDVVNALMDANGARGQNAYLFCFGNVSRAMWYEHIDE